jgi:hypothetical protein
LYQGTFIVINSRNICLRLNSVLRQILRTLLTPLWQFRQYFDALCPTSGKDISEKIPWKRKINRYEADAHFLEQTGVVRREVTLLTRSGFVLAPSTFTLINTEYPGISRNIPGGGIISNVCPNLSVLWITLAVPLLACWLFSSPRPGVPSALSYSNWDEFLAAQSLFCP